MRTFLLVILMVASTFAHCCTVISQPAFAGELNKALDCDGRVVASERVRLISSKQIAERLCEYGLVKKSSGLPGCRVGSDPYCGMVKESNFKVFAFEEECDWSNPERTFQLGRGVTADELPQIVGAFNAAKRLVANPQGAGWSSPMQVLAKAELLDLTKIEKEDEGWTLHLRVCAKELVESSCERVVVSFSRSPRFLEDLRAFWVD